MADQIDYWPTIEVDGDTYHLLSCHFTIDWGGRQIQAEFQNEKTFKTMDAIYFYLKNEWSNPDMPVDDRLTTSLRRIFVEFDTGKS